MSEPLNIASPSSTSLVPLSAFSITPSAKKLMKHKRRPSEETEKKYIPVPTAKIYVDT